jgi:hypothetical protein
MSRALKTYLLVFAVLIAVMIVIDQTRQKPLDWSPSYYLDEKKPLDLYVLNQEIDRLFDDSVVRYSKSPFEYFQPSGQPGYTERDLPVHQGICIYR